MTASIPLTVDDLLKFLLRTFPMGDIEVENLDYPERLRDWPALGYSVRLEAGCTDEDGIAGEMEFRDHEKVLVFYRTKDSR